MELPTDATQADTKQDLPSVARSLPKNSKYLTKRDVMFGGLLLVTLLILLSTSSVKAPIERNLRETYVSEHSLQLDDKSNNTGVLTGEQYVLIEEMKNALANQVKEKNAILKLKQKLKDRDLQIQAIKSDLEYSKTSDEARIERLHKALAEEKEEKKILEETTKLELGREEHQIGELKKQLKLARAKQPKAIGCEIDKSKRELWEKNQQIEKLLAEINLLKKNQGAMDAAKPISRDSQSKDGSHPVDTPTTPKLAGLSYSQKSQNTALYTSLHKTDQAVLGLLDWEEKSLKGLISGEPGHADETCTPPPGVSKACCLGSHSAGGAVNWKRRYKCSGAFHGPDEQFSLLKEEVSNFFQLNSLRQDTSGLQCDICQIVELARINALNISFIGDSMQSQVFEGMLCELQRRGYSVESRQEKATCPGGCRLAPYRDIRAHNYLQVRSPAWDTSAHAINISYHMEYRLPVNNNSQPKLDEILSTSQVLLSGYGLHWKHKNGDIEAYSKAMGEFIAEALSEKSAVQLFVQRETSAQHFDSPGGDFGMFESAIKAGKNVTKQCVNRLGVSTYWRDRALRSADLQNEYNYQWIQASPNMPQRVETREVVALPYHNLTQHFHRMHPGIDGGGDCTHYCGSPYMYMTLWRSLRLAMDRKWGVGGKQ